MKESDQKHRLLPIQFTMEKSPRTKKGSVPDMRNVQATVSSDSTHFSLPSVSVRATTRRRDQRSESFVSCRPFSCGVKLVGVFCLYMFYNEVKGVLNFSTIPTEVATASIKRDYSAVKSASDLSSEGMPLCSVSILTRESLVSLKFSTMAQIFWTRKMLKIVNAKTP